MKAWIGSLVFLALTAYSIAAEGQVEKTPKSETKGTFVTTVGTHVLYGGRIILRIEEKDGVLDSYVTRNQVEGEPQQPGGWGPINPRIKTDAAWFIYAESADEVWWFDGDKHLYMFPYNHHRPGYRDGGIYELKVAFVLKEAPQEVLDRLPKAFKEGVGPKP